MEKAITVKDVSVQYDSCTVLFNASFVIPKGSFSVIVGPNGSGKSSILKAIMGGVKFKGVIKINNRIVNNHNRQLISYAPQNKAIDSSFPINIYDFVAMGSFANNSCLWGIGDKEYKEVNKIIKCLKLEDCKQELIGNVSGGQLQKAILGRAMLQGNDVIVLDEPFSAVDFASEKLIMNELRKMCSKGKTVIIVSHNLYKAKFFDWVVFINKGVIAYGKYKEVFNETNLAKTYSVDVNTFENILKLSGLDE
ncbi:MAG: metal ABC transporter ATP-binding protein [Chlamydiia bacterium]|nr:metal ABC transporter ATP-binding protein [Chlamydiia bacterium]